MYAPGLKEEGTAPYLVGHNLLKAHVKAYKVYQAEFKAKQNGKVKDEWNFATEVLWLHGILMRHRLLVD